MVVESFFNSYDGFHWAKIAIWGDEGLAAVNRGWTLSNAYKPTNTTGPGQWHGVPYDEEILDAEYEHLAIVPDPRYAESMILTPEKFKAYNDSKAADLKRYANSKEKKPMGLKVYKRVVENTKELDVENLYVELPKSKKEVSFAQVINAADTYLNMAGYASEDHMVKVGNEEMTVKKLAKGYTDCMNELEKMKNADSEDEDDDAVENEDVTQPTSGDALGEDEDDKLYNEDDEEVEEDSEDSAKDKTKNKSKKNSDELAAKRLAAARRLVAQFDTPKTGNNFERLKNAHRRGAPVDPEVESRTFSDGIARGNELFGSN